MKHRPFLLLALTTFTLIPLLLTGCDSQSKDYLYEDDTKIAAETDNYFQYKSISNADGSDYTSTIKHFSGMETIWRLNAPSDTILTGNCDLSVLTGNVKLVLITPDNKITTILESTEDSSVQGLVTIELPVKKGLNRLKLVAKNKAELKMNLDLSEGQAE
jgi:hypothetical protein